jgi:hypothetical protein
MLIAYRRWGEPEPVEANLRARQLADEIAALGEVSGDLLNRVMGWDASVLTCFHLWKFTAGQSFVEKSLAIYDPAQRLDHAKLLPNATTSRPR